MAPRSITVFAYECQPIVVEGLQRALESDPALQFIGAAPTPAETLQTVANLRPDVVLISHHSGERLDAGFLAELRLASPQSRLVLWTSQPEGGESFLEFSFQSVIGRTRPVWMLLECLRAAGENAVWIEETRPEEAACFVKRRQPPRLTPREREVAQLVAGGMKNKDIAKALSISPGTVKVHLMHIFEKAGLQDRFQLAIHARRLVNSERRGPAAAGDQDAPGELAG
jgi:two-component system nitrate/nitrite response regulator NarL